MVIGKFKIKSFQMSTHIFGRLLERKYILGYPHMHWIFYTLQQGSHVNPKNHFIV